MGLSKYSKKGPLGILGDTLQSRWFKLNPATATLSCHLLGCCYAPPKNVYKLADSEELDTKVFHHTLFLKFRGASFLRVKARSAEDFQKWMDALKLYVDVRADINKAPVSVIYPVHVPPTSTI